MNSTAILTVNVIELLNEGTPSVLSMRSFPDDASGNAEAEALFAHAAKENGAKPDRIPSYIEDGIFEDGTYSLLLTHSTHI